MPDTTITRRPGRYARTHVAAAKPSQHTIEISAGPDAASYGALEEGGRIKLWSAGTAAIHTFRAVAR